MVACARNLRKRARESTWVYVCVFEWVSAIVWVCRREKIHCAHDNSHNNSYIYANATTTADARWQSWLNIMWYFVYTKHGAISNLRARENVWAVRWENALSYQTCTRKGWWIIGSVIKKNIENQNAYFHFY